MHIFIYMCFLLTLVCVSLTRFRSIGICRKYWKTHHRASAKWCIARVTFFFTSQHACHTRMRTNRSCWLGLWWSTTMLSCTAVMLTCIVKALLTWTVMFNKQCCPALYRVAGHADLHCDDQLAMLTCILVSERHAGCMLMTRSSHVDAKTTCLAQF